MAGLLRTSLGGGALGRMPYGKGGAFGMGLRTGADYATGALVGLSTADSGIILVSLWRDKASD